MGRMVRLIQTSITVCVLVGSSSALEAQDTLRVDHEGVDGSFLDSYSVVWRATRTGADGAVSEFTVEEEYEVLDEGDEALFKMTQVWNDTEGEILFVTVRVAELENLELYSSHTGRSPGGVAHLDIDKGFLSGFYAPDPEDRLRRFNLQLEERPFASMSGVMMAAFPFSLGAELVYPRFGWGGMTNPTVSWRTIRVLARESVSIPDRGEMEAWKVAEGSTTYWVTREAPYFLKAEAVSANGQKTVCEIAEWAR